jgi:hypothetical protein
MDNFKLPVHVILKVFSNAKWIGQPDVITGVYNHKLEYE